MEDFMPIEPMEDQEPSRQSIIIAEKKNKNRKYNNFFEWVETIVAGVVCAVLCFTFVVRMVGVEGISMQPTLYEGDRILLSNLIPVYSNGDVVVVTKHHIDDRPLVKRIIATAGQTIDIDFEHKKVSLSIRALLEGSQEHAAEGEDGSEA